MAELLFTYGTMNSGKSMRLLAEAFSLESKNRPFLTAKPARDIKGDRNIVARAGLSREADLLFGPDDDVYKLVKAEMARRSFGHLERLLVDEAQFSSPEQIDQLNALSKRVDIRTHAYGIRTDFQGVLFPGSRRLFEVANRFFKIETTCRCGEDAEFNARQDDGKFVFTGNQVAVEVGNTTYEPLCLSCYEEEKEKAA